MKSIIVCITFLYLFTQCSLWERYQSQKEELSGGDTTTFDRTLNAFNKPASNLKNHNKILKFNKGNQTFKATWTNEQGKKLTGLGPLFNSNSCNGCHFLSGRGHNKLEGEKDFRSMIFKLSYEKLSPLPGYGSQIQDKSINKEKISIEVTPNVTFQEKKGHFPDGEEYTLLEPKYEFTNWKYGEPEKFSFSPRVAPVIYGMGLLSLISEETLKAIADPEDKNKDGISGKINMAFHYKTREQKVGRFGWKASHPDIKQIISVALHQDMGITSELFPNQNCEPEQIQCKKAQGNNKPEIDKDTFDDLDYYTMLVAVPARRYVQDSDVLQGRKLFSGIGCINCHIRELKTGNNLEYPELSNQVIYPYTDLLLHDMGEGLADGVREFSASGKEWRTSPLWGLGMYPLVSQHNRLLHDGRARGVKEAILWHGGEAQQSKEAYMNLTKEQRSAVLEFLRSL